jgi:hypothetical protein
MNDPTQTEELIINFSSGYIRRSIDQWPRQGSFAPWRLYQNYALDMALLRHGRLDDRAMEFSTPNRSTAGRWRAQSPAFAPPGTRMSPHVSRASS